MRLCFCQVDASRSFSLTVFSVPQDSETFIVQVDGVTVWTVTRIGSTKGAQVRQRLLLALEFSESEPFKPTFHTPPCHRALTALREWQRRLV